MIELNIVQKNNPKTLTLNILPNVSSTNTVPKKSVRKYTLSVFLERAREVHGTKYDYSLVREEHIQGAKSKVLVKCKYCSFRWDVSIDTHINRQRGCPNCAGVTPWTLKRFLSKAKETHGDRYDYSQITDGYIQNVHSKVPVKCKHCSFEWDVSINSHINSKRGCPDCAGKVTWTLKRFLLKAKEIHGDMYDYSQITDSHIQGQKSKVPVKCNDCDYQWDVTIAAHINGKTGCPDCSGNARWTLERFLSKTKEIYGDKFDYSQITNVHIQGQKSKVPVKCNDCDYRWDVTIADHINRKTGCPDCAGNLPWTLERFLSKAKEIRGDKYNYSGVNNRHIHGGKSKVPVKCNDCGYQWDVSINGHINGKSGCPDCSGNARWTLERFLTKAKEIHGDTYDYSQITDGHIQGYNSKVLVKCKNCNNNWSPTIGDHIYSKSGCPHCSRCKGYSKKQIDWLDSIMSYENISIQYALSHEGEYKIPTLGKVDGYCLETNTVYEYHGKFWHGHPDIYNPEDVNPISGKTYGELYAKTIERDQRIRDLGYKLIVKWEE
jgi:formylmethanofuran dehydrogenase subunit E